MASGEAAGLGLIAALNRTSRALLSSESVPASGLPTARNMALEGVTGVRRELLECRGCE